MNTKTAIITIAGRPNVGKSTLTNFLVGEKIAIVSNKPQTTRNRICGIVTRDNMQFVFVDTPGYHKARTKLGDYMVNTVRESISDVDATILVVEPIPSVGAQEEALIEKIRGTRCPAILAINKIDTVERTSCWRSSPSILRPAPLMPSFPFPRRAAMAWMFCWKSARSTRWRVPSCSRMM